MEARTWQSSSIFEWVQPTLSGPFILQLEGKELGRMEQPSWLSSLWHGESEFGRWKFQGVGLWRNRYELRDRETEHLLGTYTMKWHASEGQLVLADGQTFTWRQTSWFKGRSVFLDSHGREVLELKRGRAHGNERFSDMFKTQGTVKTSPARHEGATLALLVFFAWFLVIVQNEEAAAAAASTAAVS